MGTDQPVLIVGNGKLGSALSAFFEHSAIPSFCWDRSPERCTNPGQTLEEALSSASYVILSLPLGAYAPLVASLSRTLRPGALCVSLAKGFSEGGDTSASFLRRYLMPSQWVIWGGPMLALELETKSPGTAVLASDEPSATLRLHSLLSSTALTISPSSDSNGVSFAGIAKNSYALALAMARTSGFGDNAWSSLVVTCTNEMAELMPLFRANPESAYGHAGLGDLLATALCPSSVHASTGIQYAKTGRMAPCEGVASVRYLTELLGSDLQAYPVLQQLSLAASGQPAAVTTDALWNCIR